MKRIGQKATAVALALGIAAAGISPASAATQNLAGGGATFQADFQAKCLAKFNADSKSNKIANGDTVKISYAGVGSGTGRTGLGDGTYKFAGSDSLGTSGSLTKDTSIWFPVAAAPLAILINLKTSKGAKITSLRLDSTTLSKILNGTITRWDNDAIKALNPGLALPDQQISVVSRADKSGSTGNLKNYLYQSMELLNETAQKNKWTKGGETQQDEFARGGLGMTGSPALVAAVAAAPGRIGYADLSDVTSNVTIVTIKNVYGDWVKPTAAAAALLVKATGFLTEYPENSSSSDSKGTNKGGTYAVNFKTSVKGAYQLTFITYMVGRTGQGSVNEQVRLYANYVLNKCSANPASIGATGYTTVGTSLIANAKSQVARITN